MTIRGGDGGTASSSGEEGEFTPGDCGSAGSGFPAQMWAQAEQPLWVSPKEVDLQPRLLSQENAP